MDEVNSSEGTPLPFQGPHLRLHGDEALPANFRPLRLVLQPSGAIIDVNRPNMLVGRHSECDVRLPLPDVSRRHCRLQFVDGSWQVLDLNSLNGIQLNGEHVTQATLAQGDRLRIGSFTFAVEVAASPGLSSSVQSIMQTLTAPPPHRHAS